MLNYSLGIWFEFDTSTSLTSGKQLYLRNRAIMLDNNKHWSILLDLKKGVNVKVYLSTPCQS